MEAHAITRQEHIAGLAAGLDALAKLLATRRLLNADESSAAATTLATFKLAFDASEGLRDRLAEVRRAVLASAEAP